MIETQYMGSHPFAYKNVYFHEDWCYECEGALMDKRDEDTCLPCLAQAHRCWENARERLFVYHTPDEDEDVYFDYKIESISKARISLMTELLMKNNIEMDYKGLKSLKHAQDCWYTRDSPGIDEEDAAEAMKTVTKAVISLMTELLAKNNIKIESQYEITVAEMDKLDKMNEEAEAEAKMETEAKIAQAALDAVLEAAPAPAEAGAEAEADAAFAELRAEAMAEATEALIEAATEAAAMVAAQYAPLEGADVEHAEAGAEAGADTEALYAQALAHMPVGEEAEPEAEPEPEAEAQPLEDPSLYLDARIEMAKAYFVAVKTEYEIKYKAAREANERLQAAMTEFFVVKKKRETEVGAYRVALKKHEEAQAALHQALENKMDQEMPQAKKRKIDE